MLKRKSVISPDVSYTFADYFKLNAETEEVLAYFGYSFAPQKLALPRAEAPAERLAELRTRLEEGLPLLGLTSETARREFLIAPVLWEAVRLTQAKIRVEYAIEVDQQLKGAFDYFLQGRGAFLVVEAKNADLTRGFTQLAVELIALDKLQEEPCEMLYGAVSIGEIWQFGQLQRQQRAIQQDLNLYRVPGDLTEVLNILIGTLNQRPGA